MSQRNEEVVRRMLDAFNRDDVEAVLATFDESCELREPPEMPDRPAQGFLGHAGIREWMQNLRETAGVEFEARTFTTSDDVIVSEWASRGVGQTSGAPIEWTTYVALRMRNGRITRAQGFLNRAEALEAAGLAE
jgi:ketosteroid isomerase-like protein